MQNKSYWKETVSIPTRNPLQGDINVDTVIIGGGMSGILTALFLQQKGRDCIVLEADRIGSGQTKNTTAKVTSQHNMIYAGMLKTMGEKKARQYAQANQKAIQEYRALIRQMNIECEWEDCPAYLYTDARQMELHNEYMAAVRLGLPAKWTDKTELPFPVKCALRFDGQGRFHPLKFLRAISKEVTVYEHTRVIKVTSGKVITEHGDVSASHIVFACHYPFVNIPGYYFMRMHQERSYVIALKNAFPIDGMYLGIDAGSLSVRRAGNLLLIGGEGHRTGCNPQGGQYERLKEQAQKHWSESQVTFGWSAQDCITLDDVPYIGRFSRRRGNWYVATGFQKWGMTSSMAAAMILSDQICGQRNPYEEVFSPLRLPGLKGVGKLIKESGQAIQHLTEGSRLPKDAEEKIGTTRCSHLGCRLEWNPEEKTYDCPCHGSRFGCRGELIDNPANKNLTGGGEMQ